MVSRSATEKDKKTSEAPARRPRKKKVGDKVDARTAASWRKGGEITGLILLALSMAMSLALLSSDPADIETDGPVGNLIGPVGAYAADILLYIFGIGSFAVVSVLFLLGGFMLIGRRPELKPSEFVGQGLFVISGAILCHLIFSGQSLFGHSAGGLVGELLGGVSAALVGVLGSYILAGCMALLAMMLVTDMSLGSMVAWVGRGMGRKVGDVATNVRAQRELKRRWREEQALLEEKSGDEKAWFVDEEAIEAKVEAELDKKRREARKIAPKRKKPASKTAKNSPDKVDETGDAEEGDAEEAADEGKGGLSFRFMRRKKKKKEAEPPIDDSIEGFELGASLGALESEPTVLLGGLDDDPPPPPGSPSKAPTYTTSPGMPAVQIETVERRDGGDAPVKVSTGEIVAAEVEIGPQIVESEAARQAREKRQQLAVADRAPLRMKRAKPGEFNLPHLSFLDYDNPDEVIVDKDQLRQMAMQLEKTLSDFGVNGKIVEICPGPVITMFEFSPAPGVKLSRIAGLSDDLAMALAAISVRIIAPIPGKGVVGIEVPNPTREMVFLKEIIADEAFQQSKKRMPLALGKNTEGGPVVADLAAMPHLLVAGATGSGKSVAVNTMIVSLLFRYSPAEVRLIMVDPKMLEFSIYEGIPHLLLPVVTDPKQAATALRWAVDEMERRYRLLADMGVRNIVTYNQRVEKLTNQCEKDLKAGRTRSDAVLKLDLDDDGTPTHLVLPFIVCIIDEFADLMMVASKDVETAVARLAQKARAAGLHLILATQRPSVDVITGLIKANFPTRIALRVAQKTDSRTILDSNGAENLLGKGDMLFLPPGSSQQQRVHGAYISEDEIERIVGFLKEQGKPQYDQSILKAAEDEEGGSSGDEEYDEHYDEAVFIVTSERRASISMIQRKLRVGYNRAARMIEMMESEGIVGPSDGSRPREVIAPPPN